MSLNETQARAVHHRGSGLLVLAGAGTGKTRVITHRIVDLVQNDTEARRILAVTFTNKAAKEMAARLSKMGVKAGRGPDSLWIGTFHAIGLRVLRMHAEDVGYGKNFTIYDDDQQESIVKAVLADIKGAEKLAPRLVLSYISHVKDAGDGPESLQDHGVPAPLQRIVAATFKRYEQELRRSNAMDFADLLGNTVTLLRKGEDGPAGWLLRRFRHVLVDEFQDTNRLQMQLIELLGQAGEVCVVGDDDQSIYGWRGADPAGMMRFSKQEGVLVVKLEDNYRSGAAILECANAVIAKNPARLGKTLRAFRGAGEPVRLSRLADEKQEAQYVASKISGPRWSDHAVLYRTHAQSRPLEEALRQRGIPYTIVGGLRFYDRGEIKDLFSYFRLALNPLSDVDLIRIANRPARGMGAKALGALKTAAHERGVSMHEAMQNASDPKLSRFCAIIESLIESRELPLREFHDRVLQVTLYRDALVVAASSTGSAAVREQTQAKIENVDEIASDIESFVQDHPDATLETYLEHVALVSSMDKETGPVVSLMTIHASKGLEFPKVFLVGFEEGILPHTNSIQAYEKDGDMHPLEEERRLAYVAITRAMDVLEITLVHQRSKAARVEPVTPSRFVRDLPRSRLALRGIS